MADGDSAPGARPHVLIEVEWPGVRVVSIDVVIEPALTYMREDEGTVLTASVARHDFDRDVLRDDPEFVAALRRWTAATPEDEVVTAQCVEPRLPDLLARLKVTPPVPSPIRFTLPPEEPPSDG